MQVQRISELGNQNRQNRYACKNNSNTNKVAFGNEMSGTWKETKQLLDIVTSYIDRNSRLNTDKFERPAIQGVVDGWNVTFKKPNLCEYVLQAVKGTETHEYIYLGYGMPSSVGHYSRDTATKHAAYGTESFGINPKSSWCADVLKYLKGLEVEKLQGR